MELVIIRHGATPGNERHAYVGSTDEPLSAQGCEQARAASRRIREALDGIPSLVYVSPLRRARQTAEAVFPQAAQVAVDGLCEMDFGVFEGKTAAELSCPRTGDPRYQEWVDGLCLGACPGGESRAQLSERVCDAVRWAVADASCRGLDQAVIVAHGGTVMAALDALTGAAGGDPLSFYRWHVACCEGYRAQVHEADSIGTLRLVDPVRL